MAERNGWKAAALVLIGLITAGGISGAIGHFQYEKARSRISANEKALVRLETTLSSLSEHTKELGQQTKDLNNEIKELRETIAGMK